MRHLTQRLLADGKRVLDVPAKLSARTRVFSTGQGRKADATDAHSVALRRASLHEVRRADRTVALRMLADRRDELGTARTLTVNRLHRLLLELVPGGAKRDLSARQARALLTDVPAGDVVVQTRRLLASELIDELAAIDARIKTAKKQLTVLVRQTGSALMDLNGIGPSGATRLIGDIGDVARFPSKAHFASWNGTAPIDASSGDHSRQRLSRAGNRRINRVLHIMAIVQLRRQRWPGLLRQASRGRQDTDGGHARAQTAAVRCRLPSARPGPEAPTTSGSGGPGRTRGGDYDIQRGRLEPQGRRFGQVTSRTRRPRRYSERRTRPRPFFTPLPPPLDRDGPPPGSSTLFRLTPARTGAPSTGRDGH